VDSAAFQILIARSHNVGIQIDLNEQEAKQDSSMYINRESDSNTIISMLEWEERFAPKNSTFRGMTIDPDEQ
jgi:hypothetical protein